MIFPTVPCAQHAQHSAAIFVHMTFGCKELVKRLMKGVFEQKLALPRYKNTWDVNIVLKELKTWIPTEE